MVKLIRTTILGIFVIMLVIGTSVFGRVYDDRPMPQPFIIKGEVAVQFEDNVDLQAANRMAKSFGAVSFNLPTVDATLLKFNVDNAAPVFPWRTEKPAVNSGLHDLTRYYRLDFPEDVDVQALVLELNQNPNIRMAEPVWAMPVEKTPNDPEWMSQWAMSSPGPDPNFYTAWDYETGSDSIKFALIDSGILYNHQDLHGNVWVNPGEDLDGDKVVYDIDDFDGIDNDGNGVIDDLIGYDFFTSLSGGVWPGEDGNTPDPDPLDFGGHGTHVAGIAAAMNNNNIDVTGAAGGWYGGHRSFRGVEIICCRVGATGADGNGYVNSLNCATAIDYAVLMGANVINASWGGSSTSAAAAANAVTQGVTFTHASGNDNSDSPDDIDFVTDVLSVSSVGAFSDTKSSFSNFGLWVDVSAPGSSIKSTYSFSYTPGVATIGGTSMAAPMVAGLALLIRSMMPSLSRAQVDSIIVATADSLALYSANPLFSFMLGSGRIDAALALSGLANAKFTADVTDGPAPLTVNFTDESPNSPTGWDWTFGTGDVSTDQNPQYIYNDPGIYSVSLITDEGNPLGPGEEHLRDYIWVHDDTLRGDSVEVPISTNIVVPVYLGQTQLVNEIQFPFSFSNSYGITYDSVSTAGLRTEHFEIVETNAYDGFNKRASVRLKASASGGSGHIGPDTGAVMHLHFTAGLTPGVLILDTNTFSSKNPKVTTIYGDYWPTTFVKPIINVSGCCIDERGDVDGTGQLDITDLLYLVDYFFVPGSPGPVCDLEADVDGSDQFDISDLLYMVDYFFIPGSPAPVSCY